MFCECHQYFLLQQYDFKMFSCLLTCRAYRDKKFCSKGRNFPPQGRFAARRPRTLHFPRLKNTEPLHSTFSSIKKILGRFAAPDSSLFFVYYSPQGRFKARTLHIPRLKKHWAASRPRTLKIFSKRKSKATSRPRQEFRDLAFFRTML